VSFTVQKALSEHVVPFGRLGCVQSPAEQVSVVHGLPSSLQVPVRGVKTQPLDVLQESFVHSLPSLQVIVGPPWQAPAPLQRSGPVQALPSEHEIVPAAGRLKQPAGSKHGSIVQGLLSLQLSAVPGVQEPNVHTSAPLQILPSEQDVPFGAAMCRQPSVGSQESAVQRLVSLQFSSRQ
jgi:hypothetical protein